MRLATYVVARDYGFAPNPFFGVCSLGTCKPNLRATAQVGDWVVGMRSKDHGADARMVFAMRVDRTVSFDQYWADFPSKRPYLSGSKKQRYGDNIYHHAASGGWIQEDSHHSFVGGGLNMENLERDTKTDKVLLSHTYYYFGAACPLLPLNFSELDWPHPGHKWFDQGMAEAFAAYLAANFQPGVHGMPIDW